MYHQYYVLNLTNEEFNFAFFDLLDFIKYIFQSVHCTLTYICTMYIYDDLYKCYAMLGGK